MQNIKTDYLALAASIGLPPVETQIQLQTDAYKELANKLAWVLGSTFRVPYANIRCPARAVANRFAAAVIKECGYPKSIAKVSPQLN